MDAMGVDGVGEEDVDGWLHLIAFCRGSCASSSSCIGSIYFPWPYVSVILMGRQIGIFVCSMSPTNEGH